MYLVNEGPVLDELCPKRQTISEKEFRKKGRILVKLLKKLDDERRENRSVTAKKDNLLV